MNKFKILRTSVLLILVCLFQLYVKGQTVQYFEPSELSVDYNHRIQLAGRVDSHYLVYYVMPGNMPQFVIFDQQGRLYKTISLPFLRNGFSANVNMIARESHLELIIQELRNGMHYTLIAAVNAEGELIQAPRYIDSTRFDLYGSRAFYQVLPSENKNYIALYRVVSGFSSTQILVGGIMLDANREKTAGGSFYIPFSREQEQSGKAFVNNAGQFFFPVYDQASNYRVGTTLRIYRSGFETNTPQVSTLYLKENKPSDFLMDWYEAKKQLVIGGLYYDFYEKRIDGAFTAFLTPGKNVADTILYMPMEKSFRKKLKSGIINMSSTAAINTLQVRYFKVNEDGTTQLLTDMFTNSAMINNPLSRPMIPAETPAESFFRSQPGLNDGAARVGASAPNTAQERDISAARNTTGSAPIRNFNDRASGGSGARPDRFGQGSINNANDANSRRINQGLNGPYNISNQPVTNSSDVLARNKTLNYKSVIFSSNISTKQEWKNYTRNLYVPGTAFTNVVIIPNKTLMLLSYEFNNRAVPFLQSHKFNENGMLESNAAAKAGLPMLFFKKNALMLDDHSLVTLYVEPEQNLLGLALIKW